ncbi:unnamed protein product [Caenorhabditis angaria]|uniref:Methyltransferase domain-containing protein n=1 Tax=Caenorhabditis angaria TaxID=860376 RepID=A0A9P1MVW3_9PELO|nr:unnamed protein product [Caenorhabditis angaria]
MSQEFPSAAYTSAQEKWLGRDHLITPTIRKVFGDVLTDKTVLDIGCGNGHYSFDFCRWGASRVVGIDKSTEMIELCKKSIENESIAKNTIRFEVADITNFHINSQFQIATAFFVLQFIHDKSELEKAIKNISNHLKSGGIFYGLVPNGVEGINGPQNMGQLFSCQISNIDSVNQNSIVQNLESSSKYLFPGASIDKSPSSAFIDGELVNINFYDKNEICGNAQIALHSRDFYNQCFKNSGFSEIEWISPIFSDYGRQVLGDQFCDQFLNPPVDIMFKVVKK